MFVMKVQTEDLERLLTQLASLAENRDKIWAVAIGYDPLDDGVRFKFNESTWGPPITTGFQRPQAQQLVTLLVNEGVALQTVIRSDCDNELQVGQALGDAYPPLRGQNIRLRVTREKGF